MEDRSEEPVLAQPSLRPVLAVVVRSKGPVPLVEKTEEPALGRTTDFGQQDTVAPIHNTESEE